eukprot:140816_1
MKDSSNVCIWGRKRFPNIYINGEYIYRGIFNSTPWYSKHMDPNWFGSDAHPETLYLWRYSSGQYVIDLNAPSGSEERAVIAGCGNASEHPRDCDGWGVSQASGGHALGDRDIFAVPAPCPQWDCDHIITTNIGNGCNQNFIHHIAPNAWMNAAGDRFWYFIAHKFRWVCRDFYDGFNACHEAYDLANTTASWAYTTKGSNISIQFSYPDHNYHVIQCMNMKRMDAYETFRNDTEHSNVCIWQSQQHDHSYLNGEYQYHGLHKYSPWYIKHIDPTWRSIIIDEPVSLHLWRYCGRYIITKRPPTKIVTYASLKCIQSTMEPTGCIWWRGSNGVDASIVAAKAPCPQWDCDYVIATDIGNDCDQNFSKQIAPNAWMNEAGDRYWYFMPLAWSWVCRESYDLTFQGQQELRVFSNDSWVNATKGTNVSLLFQHPQTNYHVIQCLGDESMNGVSSVYHIAQVVVILFTICVGCLIYKIIQRMNNNLSDTLNYQNNINIEQPINVGRLIIRNNQRHRPIVDAEIMTLEQRRIDLIDVLQQDRSNENLATILEAYQRLLQDMCNDENHPWQDCNIMPCPYLHRHYRDRDGLNRNKSLTQVYGVDIHEIASQQIIDKIHCILHHSTYEITEEKQSNDSAKQHILTGLQKRINQKYNQFDIFMQNNENMFIFGREFVYIDGEEQKHSNYNDDDCVHIYAKYGSLKEELTKNNLTVLSMAQFINEQNKANIHYDSYTRKRYHPSISKQHVLALMIYCNFDHLQNIFSKSYRENITQHSQFYHLGKLLKEAVIEHGKSIKDGNITNFYHGINQSLVPVQIVGDLGKGISVFCPLSTSRSYSVAAARFTNNFQGFIITFGGKSSKAKYFTVEWLSDFPQEHECLFLQNMEEMQIINIIDCQQKVEFGGILEALKAMDFMFYDGHYSTFIRPDMEDSIIKIIQHQLSTSSQSGKHPYEQQLINVYFANKKKLTINYAVLEAKYPRLFDIICVKEYSWIRIDVLNAIFSDKKKGDYHLQYLDVININLCSRILDDILLNARIFYPGNDSWNLKQMVIRCNKSSELNATKAASEYEAKFRHNKPRININRIDWSNKSYDSLKIT